MSEFHENIRAFLEDVQLFLKVGLKNEALSGPCLTNKEELIYKLSRLSYEYPQLQLTSANSSFASHPTASSPQPYLDMQTKHSVLSSHDEGHYYDVAAEDEYETVSPTPKVEEQQQLQQQCGMETKVMRHEPEDEKEINPIPAADLQDVFKSGFLDKKGKERLGGFFNASQKRWCAIKDGVFYYYDRPTDKRQKGQINLAGYEVRPVTSELNKDSSSGKACFELVCPGRRTFQFVAVSMKDMKQWVAAIEQFQHTSPVMVNTSIENGSLNLKTDDEDDDIYESLENNLSFEHQPLSPIGSLEHDYDEGLSLGGTGVNDSKDSDETDLYADAESMLTQVMQITEKYSKGNEITNSVNANRREQTQQVVYVEGEGHVINPSSWVIGVWDCSGSTANELNFKRGDLIKVLSREYDEYSWWVGQLGAHVGLIPKNYITPAYVKVP